MRFQEVVKKLEKYNKTDVTIMNIRSYGKATSTIEVRVNNKKEFTISRPQMDKLVDLGYYKYFM